ncbi:tetratricopeptide repeat protein [Parabacteroides chinchillae]|uniref:Tetratricopeptide repeat-containing protein n=1 Tax=Parabacteroides chinchillae TaxID=871327 RepID=A0A8G2BWG4_9BACT|nr:tetratricopeptide repeat protein [Parabacteroides chinchillae]SEF87365.1 Tetratricopeptide repeat-containing protein [Parabacteroides chinchillae]
MIKIISILLLAWGFCLQIKAQSSTLQQLVDKKRYAAVTARADSLTAADSADYATMSAIGQAYEGMLQYRKAFGFYTCCLNMDTSNIDMLNTLARTAINLGRVSDAKRLFYKVLSNDSTNFYANYQLARLYQQLGDYRMAIDMYHQLMDWNGVSSALYRNVGDCYTRLEEYPAAALCYFQAYNQNRENASLASALINTMLRIGGTYQQEALAICDTALYYNPDNRLLRQNKGMALYMNRMYSEADTLYAQLLAEGDSSYFTLKYGGASKYYAGQYLDAIEPLEAAYNKDTTAVEVNLLLGSALGKTFDRNRAYVLLDKAEEGLKPDEFLSNQLLGFRAETKMKDGHFREASRLYYQMWKNDPGRLDVLFNIMKMYSGGFDVNQYKNEEDRQRGLFIYVLYLSEYLESKKDKESLFYYRPLLESFYQDMFFKSVTEETMLAPDGKKSKLTVIDLRNLICKLPEMPDDFRNQLNKVKK